MAPALSIRLLRASYREISNAPRASTVRHHQPTTSPNPVLTTPLLSRLAPSTSSAQRRRFSKTALDRQVQVTSNPRQDDEGNDMLVNISASASKVCYAIHCFRYARESLMSLKRLKEIMTKDQNSDLALRVVVESGGCHGFQYLMSLINRSAISSTDDTVFEATDGSGARVVMDEPSLELLKGSTIDYTTALIGSQFKITGNPAASSSCGCGTSFDIKV